MFKIDRRQFGSIICIVYTNATLTSTKSQKILLIRMPRDLHQYSIPIDPVQKENKGEEKWQAYRSNCADDLLPQGLYTESVFMGFR